MKTFGINNEEITILKQVFKEYKKQYSKLKKQIVVDDWKWSKSFYFNLKPFEIELKGFKKGTLLKEEPENKSNVVQYGFYHDEIICLSIYGQKFLLSEKICIKNENKNIILGFGDSNDIKNLNQVCVIFYENDRPVYSLSMEKDDDEITFVKENYEYNDLSLNAIYRKGFISEEGDIETIIDYVFFINYENENVKEILGRANNLTSNQNKTVIVYPPNARADL
jgi:hypothetical protein